MKGKTKLKKIDGNFQPNTWLHDPDSFSDEDVDFINSAWKEAAKEIDPVFEKLIWEPTKRKAELKRVK